MFKTRLLTPLLVLAAFLGIGGVQTTASASIVSDKQTMIEMGKKSIVYSGQPFWEDYDWADANMVSPAKDNPYRYKGKIRAVGALYTIISTAGSLVYNAMNANPKDIRNNSFTFKGNKFTFYSPKAATVIISYFANANDLGDRTRSHHALQRKIWFVKVNGQWKIKNYYTILTKFENSGTNHKWVMATPQNDPAYKEMADKT